MVFSPFLTACSAAPIEIEDGKIWRIAGGGDIAPNVGVAAREAKFQSVDSVAFDRQGRLLIADAGSFIVWRVEADGRLTRAVGRARGISNRAVDSSFGLLTGLAYDGSNNLYVVDKAGFTIYRILPGGEMEIAAGNGSPEINGDGSSALDTAIQPEGAIAVDRSNGWIYFIDRLIFIKRFKPGEGIETVLDTSTDPILTNRISHLTVDSAGNLITSTRGKLLRISPDGKAELLAELSNPQNFRENLRFAVLSDDSVVAWDPAGVNFQRLMPDGSRPGISLVPREHCPAYSSISVMGSTADRILVASPRALCAMDSDGNLAFVAGDSSPADGSLRIGDGEPAGKAALGNPVAIAVAPDGTIAFLERETNRIRKVAPTPEIQ